MVYLFLLVLLIIVAIFVPRLFSKMGEKQTKVVNLGVRAGIFVLALYLVFSTSYVIIGADEIGHLKRIYFGKTMPPGQIIAFDGQKGPQANILPPGFKFKLLLNVLYDVDKFAVLEIKEGNYGFMVASDGAPLREGQYLADAWPSGKVKDMLDAKYFLKNGGQKGPQLTVLSPGKYRLNKYLFKIESHAATDIPAGFVGVIKSNIQETPQWKAADLPHELAGVLAVPLVEKGSIGIWNEPLPPGRYYLNNVAYNVTKIDTRVQMWNYKGGYERRFIDLHVTQDGRIEQKERSETLGVPANAADSAVFTRMEGWLVPQELRVQVQVEPKDAPFLVASVGNVSAAEDKVVTPSIRSVVRNICAAEKVIHLIDENRAENRLLRFNILRNESPRRWSRCGSRLANPIILHGSGCIRRR